MKVMKIFMKINETLLLISIFKALYIVKVLNIYACSGFHSYEK